MALMNVIKRLVSKPGVRDPLAHLLYCMKELLRKEACGSAVRVSSSIYIPVIPMLIMLTY